MTERIFKDRTLPLDSGVDVLITGDGTSEDDVFIEYRSDSLLIYTGERAREARGQRRPIAARQAAAVIPPKAETRADDYVPPPVVPPSGSRMKKSVETVNAESFEIPVEVGEEAITEEPLAPLRTSTAPRAPIDRTGAQLRAVKIDTVMPTSLGEAHVQADLSGMLKRA